MQLDCAVALGIVPLTSSPLLVGHTYVRTHISVHTHTRTYVHIPTHLSPLPRIPPIPWATVGRRYRSHGSSR